VCLGVSAALEVPGLPQPAHLIAHGGDYVVEIGLFARLDPLFRQLQTIILALEVNQRGTEGIK
jgi:hypothetical protein